MAEGQGSWDLGGGVGVALYESQLAALGWEILPKLPETRQGPAPDTEAHVRGWVAWTSGLPGSRL